MTQLSNEQIDHISELSKDDRMIIVGSEIRQLCDQARAYNALATPAEGMPALPKRYRFVADKKHPYANLVIADEGDYVLSTDYDALRTAYANIYAENGRLRAKLDGVEKIADMMVAGQFDGRTR